jgi:hypothetical protein
MRHLILYHLLMAADEQEASSHGSPGLEPLDPFVSVASTCMLVFQGVGFSVAWGREHKAPLAGRRRKRRILGSWYGTGGLSEKA